MAPKTNDGAHGAKDKRWRTRRQRQTMAHTAPKTNNGAHGAKDKQWRTSDESRTAHFIPQFYRGVSVRIRMIYSLLANEPLFPALNMRGQAFAVHFNL
ncbi:MAG: hypothetical protein A3J24_01645 [Deltaproteobacteria bacterium RIFCSPLOWO2_02_FULL_53_8]|nr:MAG: hypothetical protein A3J24_01645 [Deltaproteobacteria bacterium RIFCSPLOWO2_02_FULL_53_8]